MTATRFIAAAALSIAAAAPAFAQEATPDTWTAIAQPQSRATVMADLVTARANGALKAMSSGYIEPIAQPLSRGEVRSQTLAALASGEAAAIDAEVQVFAQPAAQSHSQVAALR